MKYYIIFWVIFLIFLVGCDKETELSDFTANRTVIVYVAAIQLAKHGIQLKTP